MEFASSEVVDTLCGTHFLQINGKTVRIDLCVGGEGIV